MDRDVPRIPLQDPLRLEPPRQHHRLAHRRMLKGLRAVSLLLPYGPWDSSRSTEQWLKYLHRKCLSAFTASTHSRCRRHTTRPAKEKLAEPSQRARHHVPASTTRKSHLSKYIHCPSDRDYRNRACQFIPHSYPHLMSNFTCSYHRDSISRRRSSNF